MAKGTKSKPDDGNSIDFGTLKSHMGLSGDDAAKFLAAKANIAAMGAGSISVQAIRDAFRQIIKPSAPSSVSYFDPVSKYIGGGPLAIIGFIDRVNNSVPFRMHGLALVPSNVPDNPHVGDFYAAIINWYEQHGWTVSH
jgi:hypothetical protein